MRAQAQACARTCAKEARSATAQLRAALGPESACTRRAQAAALLARAPARLRRAASGIGTGVDACADAFPNAAAPAAADGPESDMCDIDGRAVRHLPIPGQRTRSTTVRRGELGRLMPAVKGGVIADADTV